MRSGPVTPERDELTAPDIASIMQAGAAADTIPSEDRGAGNFIAIPPPPY